MAVHALIPAIAPANAILGVTDTVLGRTLVATATSDPLVHMLAIAATMLREDVEAAIDAMIARLDAADGDTDREELGLEDGFLPTSFHDFGRQNGPGCPISDIDCCPAGDDDPLRNGDARDKDGDAEPWFVPAHWPMGFAA